MTADTLRRRWRHATPGLLLLATITGCSKPPQQDARTEPPVVIVAKATPTGDIGREFSGIITARVQSNLGFRVAGKIIERLVDAGQAVKKDQPLMRLDPVDLQLATAIRQAAVDAAKARAIQAIAEDARQRDLIEHGATSKTLYDTAKAGADSARAEVALAEAALHTAQDNEGYTTLYADADGIVVETFAEPGQVVATGQTIIKLAHAGPREAAVFLPETIRPALGSVATATLYGGTASVTAKLRQLSNSADPGTRTYEARYVLDGPCSNAPLGATVTIELPEELQALTIPNAAIADRGSGAGVWIVNADNTVSFRNVQIDRLTEENAILRNGLKRDEEVVALGAHLLNEGEKVRIAKKETAVQ